MNITIPKIEVSLSDNLKVNVGQALKAGTEKQIFQMVKENLNYLIKDNILQKELEELKNLNLFQFSQAIKKYHNSSITTQFHGLNQNIKHYKIDETAKELTKKAFKCENIMNNIRSAILGLPNSDFSIGIQSGDKYYFLSKYELDTEKLLRILSDKATNSNALKIKEKETRKFIGRIIELIEDGKINQKLSLHFQNMMEVIPKYSKNNSTPQLKWAAEVFEFHIQDSGEKTGNILDHSWFVAGFWNLYHETQPYYDINGHRLQLASATQGGDANQTQVKTINLNNKKLFLNTQNLNNLQDMFSFWMDFSEKINNKKITDKDINEILSVLLSAQTINELGLEVVASIREIGLGIFTRK